MPSGQPYVTTRGSRRRRASVSISLSMRKRATEPPITPAWRSGSQKGDERGRGQEEESAGRAYGNDPERGLRILGRGPNFFGASRRVRCRPRNGIALFCWRRYRLLGGAAG